MPTYEYECAKCGNHFDYFQSMKDAPLTDCPEEACGGKGTVKRLISSGTGLIFKGTGFYATDYKKSNACVSPSKSSDSARESKSEAAPCACPNAGSCPMAEKKD